MTDHARTRRNIFGIAFAASLSVAVGCRTGADDVHRWANTQQGPRKIVAVMTHDKYPDDLRIEAAMTLVRMKPRSGRRVGIDELVTGLSELPAAGRAKIVTGMVPLLETEIRRPPPPKADTAGVREVDTTFPYKDAAFALLTNEGEVLVANKEDRLRLQAALGDWAMADFSARMDDSSQAYGMGQLLAELGPDGVRRLPALIAPEERKIGNIVGLIADLGDAQTKLEASRRLVKVAEEVDSEAWLKRKGPELKQANAASGHNVEGARFDAQLALYQDEELMRVLSSMKQVGQAPAVDYLLSFAADKDNSEKRREAALAAMEGHVDRKNTAQVERLLALAGADETPDGVRDQAFRRVGELPRKQVINLLYQLFSHQNWKVRWVAAELVLKTSEVQHLPEFMQKLGKVPNMAITEPIRYGKLIGGLQGSPPPRDVMAQYTSASQPTPVRLTALAFYLEHGTKDHISLVAPYATDGARVPECAKDADGCEWQCEIVAEGQQLVKPVQTVGDFVEYCVQPAIVQRTAPVTVEDKTAKN